LFLNKNFRQSQEKRSLPPFWGAIFFEQQVDLEICMAVGYSFFNHLGLWDVKRKPPPRANGPPTEAIIIYDESSAPSADDPPSIYSTRHVPLSVLLLWRDTSAFGSVPSARHVT
jgi:hypothetical protein